METKKVKVPFLQKEELKETHFHFGYTLKDEIDADSETLLIFERDKKYPLMNKVVKLEKLYKKSQKKIPLSAIITLSLALILILIAIFIQNPIAKLVLYIVGSALAFYGGYELISFFIVLFNKKKIQKAIFKKCDEYLFQNLPDLPFRDEIAKKNDATDDIKKNVKLP